MSGQINYSNIKLSKLHAILYSEENEKTLYFLQKKKWKNIVNSSIPQKTFQNFLDRAPPYLALPLVPPLEINVQTGTFAIF